MLSTKRVCEIARDLPGVTEYEHFGSDAFRTSGGTFVTVWHAKNSVNLNLTVEQQGRFLLIDGEGFIAVDNAWGRQGWTTANLEFAADDDVREALQLAWSNTMSKPPRKKRARRNANA